MKIATVLPRLVALIVAVTLLAGCLYGQHMRRGDRYLQNRSYQNAIVEYKAALRERPGSAEAQRKLQQAEQVYFGQLHGEVDDDLASGDIEAAIESANSAYNVNPDDSSAREMVSRVAHATLDHAHALTESRRFARANWLLVYAADSLPPARETMNREREEVRSAWIDWATASARGHESNGRLAAAALYWAQAAKVSGDNMHSTRARTLASRLRQEHELSIFVSASHRNSATTSVVNRLAVPPEGMAVGFAGAATPETHEARVRAERVRFDSQVRTRLESVNYVSGTRTVPNPDYRERSEDLRQARHRLNVIEDDMRRARRRYDYSGSEYDRRRYNELVDEFNEQSRYVARLRDDLDRTPMEYEEESIATHNYQVETRIRTASMSISAEVVAPNGSVVAQAARNPSVSASDEFHAAQPIAGIPSDPLQLPSDQQLMERLYDDGADGVMQVVEQAFEAHRNRAMARTRKKKGDLEGAALYLLLYPRSANAAVIEELAASSGVQKPDEVLAAAI